MGEAKHTPGPWHWTHDGEGQPGRVGVVLPCEPVEDCGYDSHCIALTQPGKFDARANAERIVQCVNAHDELVGALEAIWREAHYNGDPANDLRRMPPPLRAAIEASRTAIAKASA